METVTQLNIFALDLDPEKCAQYHNNKHVVKMILEGAQLLSNAHHLYGNGGPFKLGWQHHRCSKWACETKENYLWLKELALELCKEYTYRYGKFHVHERTIQTLPEINLPKNGMTAFHLAMPEDCKLDDSVESYQLYYRRYKQHLKQYKYRNVPSWY